MPDDPYSLMNEAAVRWNEAVRHHQLVEDQP